MDKRLVEVSGCDDTTRVVLDLTEADLACLERLSEAVNAASSYLCMPKLYVKQLSGLCQHYREIGEYCGDCPDYEARAAVSADAERGK